MPWTIVDAKNEKPWSIPKKGYPVLIHGVEGSGASFFTVILAASMIREHEPTLFACAKPVAVRQLQDELGLKQPAVRAKKITGHNVARLEDSLLVTIHNDQPEKLEMAIQGMKDWSERTIILKNIEQTMSTGLRSMLLAHKRVVLSGDLNKLKISISPESFGTIIAFSDLPSAWVRSRSALPPYVGRVWIGGQKAQTLMVVER